MKLSIVIPCFNQARFIGEAAKSACRQTWPSIDVIVVDDGSTDGSGAIAAEHPGVRVLWQANRGLAAARNAGLAAATGDIVIFLDADDRLLPDAARHAVDAFTAHPTAGMVFGRCRLIDEEGRVLPVIPPEVHRDFYAELLRRNFIWTPGMAAFRRSTLQVIGPFDSAVNPSADYDMYLRIARRFPIAAHGEFVMEYRRHGNGMTANPLLMLESTLVVVRRQEEFVERYPLLRAAWLTGIRHWRWFYGEQLVERFREALHRGRYADAALDAARLLRLYPEGVRHHLWKKTLRVAR